MTSQKPEPASTHLFDGVSWWQTLKTIGLVIFSGLSVLLVGWVFDLRTLTNTPWAALSGPEDILPKKLLGLAIGMALVEVVIVAVAITAYIHSWQWYGWIWPISGLTFFYGELLWIRYFREDPHPYGF
ncbi:MAG: hypothetical protein Q7R71_00150 [bacterium]|nr:hypothetical protein [bacterium]